MTNFCLVRHGQTDWNLEGRYQGQSDVPLNENGRIQARNLAIQLSQEYFDSIYSSDLKRAAETAHIIADRLHLSVHLDLRLREINQGDWEGQLVEVIQARYADLWEQRTVDPASVRPPGGETVGEVADRVAHALDEISARYPAGKILLVSHGLSLATVICKVRGIPTGQAYQFIPENASPILVQWVSGRTH
jgi:broad specificity phosphatase PhoE